MTFIPGWKPQHDLAKAGKKGAARSPWRKGFSTNSNVQYGRLKKPLHKERNRNDVTQTR
jgi:hypothetical protein